jgi:hypothetical protein
LTGICACFAGIRQKFSGSYFVKSKHILSLSIMRTLQIAFGLLLITVLAASCVRENDVITPGPVPVAGKGGKTKLEVTPKHHGKDITNGVVYIEYNTTMRPPDGKYDDSAVVGAGKMTAAFDSLKWGNYFLYCYGYDANVKEDVLGTGVFANVDSTKNTYSTIIEVTEASGANHK